MTGQPTAGSDIAARNRRTGWIVAGAVFGMLGLSFAAVPLYDLFCRTTGYGGRPMVAKEPARSLGTRLYTVRFDAGIAGGLNWRFEAAQASIEVRPGQVTTAHYTVRNVGPTESVGIASFNVLPEITGGYFNKLECFCYTEQALKPGEAREETVVFFLDPAIETDPGLSHVHTVTLSYTFHPAKGAGKSLAANQSSNGEIVQ
ncbi:MAG TPA: cytochrome c oxidase assembly protein [Beijerinckiaceae bacterium]|nr:cytochrome c oxidase assembly protein [Beijerinckiaceae bacterium]